jgi:hypothetical protein
MRKLTIVLAAIGALGIAAPTAVLADTIIIHKHHHHFMPPPPMVMHHHHDNNRTVIIKHND